VAAQVAAAFVSACELLEMEPLWQAIDAAGMPEKARLALFEQAALALRGHMADLLRAGGATLKPSTLMAQVAGGVAELMDHVDDLLAAEAREHSRAIAQALIETGSPEDLASRVACLFALDGAIGLSYLSRDTGVAPVTLANAFINLGERLGLDWAQSRAAVMNPSDPWERLLVAGLARDFQQMRFEFLRQLSQRHAGVEPLALIDEWTQSRESAIRPFRAMIGRAQSTATLSPTMLAQIASQARNLLQR
jgi:glutamate dehydrogenase